MRIDRTSQSGTDAQHSSHSPTVADGLDELRQALEAGATVEPSAEPVQAALRRVCEIARKERMPPELLLIHLKHTLDDVPGWDARAGEAAADARTQIVSCVIDRYFAA